MKKRDVPVHESTRRRIVARARDYFFAYGFRGVTMDDLARELGMSKKTLYAHFRSKVELVQAVLLNKSQDVEADLERITSEDSSDFPAALHELLTCMQRHLEEIHPPFVRDIRPRGPGTVQAGGNSPSRSASPLFRQVPRRRAHCGNFPERCSGQSGDRGLTGRYARNNESGEDGGTRALSEDWFFSHHHRDSRGRAD